ncbi:M10 family metallopeptidase C-terminal domain-containing protein [uncultured Amaricoccus sp.]|uniref:M10 family metallopeptidase C-terminal domain-containing protein n=1 Tax=uncultured Amaricoccus sp. TaxID=339341 RepID=UPI00262DB051|nr:M10 family metallopeptidase C-terminal domain-containing protein [uncultured Amaricoccus sp.]
MTKLRAYDRLGYGLDMSNGNTGVSFFAPGTDFEAEYYDYNEYGVGPDSWDDFYKVTSGFHGGELYKFSYIDDDLNDIIGYIALTDQRIGSDNSHMLISWNLDLRFASSEFDFDGFVGSDRIQGNKFKDVIKAGAMGDDLIGRGGDDKLWGQSGNDRLYGGTGDDRASGGDGRDFLDGGAGADRLTGGDGADVFLFRTLADPGSGAEHDVILDFRSGVDRVRLDLIDADATRSGVQVFDFIGPDSFGGVAGELRFSGGFLAGDVDGDGRSDFRIALAGDGTLVAGDLVL